MFASIGKIMACVIPDDHGMHNSWCIFVVVVITIFNLNYTIDLLARLFPLDLSLCSSCCADSLEKL
jgi:hypothetical protein